MAQTKRKRRSKHRGNAAGTIEARGRTGRKPTAEEQRKSASANAREERRFVEPSWTSAATRAGLASVMLFVLFQVGLAGEKQTHRHLARARRRRVPDLRAARLQGRPHLLGAPDAQGRARPIPPRGKR